MRALPLLVLSLLVLPGPSVPIAGLEAPRAAPARAGLPFQAGEFVANAGQWPDEVRFVRLGRGTTSWVFADGFAQRFARWSPRADGEGPRTCEGAVVRTRFLGAAGRACGQTPGAAAFHFLRGQAAVTACSFERVVVGGLFPGVDLVLRNGSAPDRGGALAYDLCLAGGADLDGIVVRCEGAQELAIAADGALVLRLPLPDGHRVDLRQTPPVAWQETAAGPRPLPVAFRLLGRDCYGFAAPGRDPALPTVVDPGLVWSTLLGGGASDSVNDLQWRPGQGLWLGGWAGSTDFPTTTGAFRTTGGTDGFVARLAEDGTTLLWATYLGGSRGDEVRALAVDGGGAVTAVGWTLSTDFPVVAGAFQPAYGGASLAVDLGDAFVARLSSNGASLLGGTYLGGGLDDVAEGVAVDSSGVATVAGWSSSPNFPTTPGVFQPALGGSVTLQPDGFVARVAPDGRSLVWSTYLGGTLPDQLQDARVDAQGNVTVVGYSVSSDYPTSVTAYRTTSAGGTDAVLSRLDATGRTLLWSTFLGGQGTERGQCLELAGDGSVWFGGSTDSANFPTTNGAFQRTLAGRGDGFVARMAANGQSLLFGTYLGGPGDDAVRALSLAPAGQPFVVGETGGGFPVTAGATQTAFGGGSLDGFVAEFDPTGAQLAFASYLGGHADEFLVAAARGGNGLAVVGGFSYSSDHPVTAGVLQSQLRGIEDGVVAQFDLDAQLRGSLRVAAAEPVPPGLFTPGDSVDALALRLTNETLRDLMPQAVRVFVGGAGDDRDLDGVSAWLDDPALPGSRDMLLAGPLGVNGDNGEVTLSLSGLPPLPPGATTLLRFVLHSRPTTPAGAEFVCAVVGNDAWEVRAEGAGSGPAVAVSGSQHIAGGAQTAVATVPFSGDDDGDGAFTVSDLRRLCQRLGQPAGNADPDGDGVITPADLRYLQDAILERPVLLGCPAVVTRSEWVSMRGWFPAGEPTVTLGGRVLAIGSVTARDVAFRIDPDQPIGSHDLQLLYPGLPVVGRRVEVQ